MRLTKVIPGSAAELSRSVLEDIEALSPGLHLLASDVPLPSRDTLDAVAVDAHGRLVLLMFSVDAGHADIGRAVDQWEWLSSNIRTIQSLASLPDVNAAIEPKVVLVTGRAGDDVRRHAARLVRLDLEIVEVTLVSEQGRRGLLIDRLSQPHPKRRASTGIDSVLTNVSQGVTRSLMRRILEELRSTKVNGDVICPVGVEGDVDLLIDGRVVASILATPSGVQVRRFDDGRCLDVGSDRDCRDAVRFVLTGTAARVGVEVPAQPETEGLQPVSLSAEEIAELGRMAAGERSSPHRDPHAPESAEQTDAKFVEN